MLTLIIALFILLVSLGDSHVVTDQSLTFFVEPGKTDCFYLPAEKGDVLSVGFQVVGGSSGDLEITFMIRPPNMNTLLLTDIRQADRMHSEMTLEETGDYELCFDNSITYMASKTVYMGIILERPSMQPEDLGGMDDTGVPTVEGQSEIILRLKQHLNAAQHMQEILRAKEARDRSIAEMNFTRVNNWSILQITVMIAMGLLQVFMVRSLFDDRSKFRQVWKMADQAHSGLLSARA
ncbi:unnamed protein product [Cyprideis torosa]|uniref:Uncharacterized protein n=1 Tax=Cyprideis torosa TaxID=163714 RepID=A0A7R8ZR74_9CRUS|nr:unnamed protein product [Cyprideis torosa]CAG0892327.1 unnamed protein product [Cyprideis torosa]